MNEPWPDDVFDCAVRLARSLGYREIHIWPKGNCVYVNHPTDSGNGVSSIHAILQFGVR